MTQKLNVLIVDDSEDDATLVLRELRRGRLDIERCERVDTIPALEAALRGGEWDVALLDFNLPTMHAISSLRVIRELEIDLPAIVVTGSIDEEVATSVFRAGARDVVVKSRLSRLAPAVAREAAERRERRDRIQIRRQLEQAEERFRIFMQSLPALAWITDRDGHLVYVNDSLCAFTGQPQHALIGRSRAEVLGKALAAQLDRGASAVLTSGAVAEHHARLFDASGRSREVLVRQFALGDEGATGALGLDMSAEMLVDTVSREAEQRFRIVANAAHDAIVTLDIDGRIVFCNRAGEAIFGTDEHELLGVPFDEFISPESRAANAERVLRLMVAADSSPTSQLAELEVMSRTGGVIGVEVTGGKWLAGDERYVTLILRDLTHRRQLEEQLRSAQKMEAVGQLAGGIAHDFNNMLSVVHSYAELLHQSFEPDDPRCEDIEQALQAVQRGAGLVRQLLAFARQQVLQPRDVDLNRLTSELESILRPTIGENVAWKTYLDPDLRRVFADPAQIEQVLVNLVVNARDALPSGGTITVRTCNVTDAAPRTSLSGRPSNAPAGDWVLLTVADDGIGMTPEVIAHIFEPFFTTKEQGKGTGLGLATVYGIVRQSNGAIHVASEVGRGTTFEVYLPIFTGTASADASGPVIRPGASVPARGECVLVVEDAHDLRRAITRLLDRDGYDVIDVESAEAALDWIGREGQKLDVMVTDVLLPRMSGTELAAEVARLHPGVAIILTTGYARGELDMEQPYRVLEKPVAGSTLLAAIRQDLDARRARRRR